MSDTPNTDAVVIHTLGGDIVRADFAREQEREINRLKSIIRGKTFVTAEAPINGSAREGRDASPGTVADSSAGPAQAAVYHVCNYLMEGKCRRCPPRVDTPYGAGESGCFAVSKEQIEVVLAALRTGSQ